MYCNLTKVNHSLPINTDLHKVCFNKCDWFGHIVMAVYHFMETFTYHTYMQLGFFNWGIDEQSLAVQGKGMCPSKGLPCKHTSTPAVQHCCLHNKLPLGSYVEGKAISC